jgi:hypothetical protein
VLATLGVCIASYIDAGIIPAGGAETLLKCGRKLSIIEVEGETDV